MDEADEDGHGLIALNRVTRSEAERFVVLELLFHHVNGNYGLGASPRDWKAFRSELNGVRRKALAFASEIRQLRELRIFAVPLIPAAFLAREGGAFPWRQTIDSPHEVFWSSAAKGLTELADYIKYVITEGDKTWDFRDFGNLNLILLSIYLKRITGEWQDERIAMLVRTAYKAAGKHWKSEKNPGAAIAELRRRFRTPESRFDGLLLAVHQTPAGRLTLKKLQLERSARISLPSRPSRSAIATRLPCNAISTAHSGSAIASVTFPPSCWISWPIWRPETRRSSTVRFLALSIYIWSSS